MELSKKNKEHIDTLSYKALLERWRFAPTGDPWFQGETGDYWPGYKEIEHRVQKAICLKFGLLEKMPAEVKVVDDALLADEAPQLVFYRTADWYLPQPPSGTRIECWDPLRATDKFLSLFNKLTA